MRQPTGKVEMCVIRRFTLIVLFVNITMWLNFVKLIKYSKSTFISFGAWRMVIYI